MITKKRIIIHGIWGGIFGLLSGIIVSYGPFGYDFIKSWFRSAYSKSLGTPFETLAHENYLAKMALLPKPFPESVQLVLYFLIPSIFLGFALGIAGKSLKKFFYAALGGLIGGLICYAIYHLVEHSILMLFVLPISPAIYSITIGLVMGIMYKSSYKTIKGCIGGIIAWLITIPLIFYPWLFGFVFGGWAKLTPDSLALVVILNLLIYIIIGIALTIGIFIGLEKEQRSLHENGKI